MLKNNRIHAMICKASNRQVLKSVSIVPTRWNSRCFQLNRLLELHRNSDLLHLYQFLNSEPNREDKNLRETLEKFLKDPTLQLALYEIDQVLRLLQGLTRKLSFRSCTISRAFYYFQEVFLELNQINPHTEQVFSSFFLCLIHFSG